MTQTTKDQRVGWLADLKVGDKVIVNYSSELVRAVDRITPTGRIKVCGYTFSPQGIGIGYDYRAPRLAEYTPEEAERLRLEAQQRHLAIEANNINYFGLSLDKLERIVAILGEDRHDTD